MPILEHPKEIRTADGPVKTYALIVTSRPVQRRSLFDDTVLLLENLPGEDYGRIVGSGGSNIKRIESEYKIYVKINKWANGEYSLAITGNTKKMLQEAADDIIQGLTVTTECCNLKQINRISSTRLKKICLTHFVKIRRSLPNDSDQKVTIIGKLNNCQSAYGVLVNELKRLR